MKKIYIILFSLFSFSPLLFAQNYFQQEVNYKIDVKLDDIRHELNAFIEIEYVNHSPDDLTFIYFHLWPNAYKDHNTAFAKQLLEIGRMDFYFSKPEDRGYIDQLDFKINNEPARFEFEKNNIDICKLFLNKPLKSGEKIIISTPFHVKIPKVFSRMGHDKNSYQITQWFPKPAVYDREGWHPLNYLDQGEYYSEYGSFDVKITLPKNYVVGATGDLQNEDEMKWLNEKAKITLAMVKPLDIPNDSFPPSSKEMKTLYYKQNNIHDFGWFADKRYYVLKGEVELPDSKRKVTTWTLFTNEEFNLWRKSIEYINDAVLFYSKNVGEYPYHQATALQGSLVFGGGMEYPNVTTIGRADKAEDLESVIVHEIGHNWFYGIFGTNERDNPWMDEGINTYYENRYMNTKYPNQHILLQDFTKIPIPEFFHIHAPSVSEYPYLIQAMRHIDQPMNSSSERVTDANYWAMIYAKTALMINYLRASLTTVEFDRVMQKYFDLWKFKHPSPKDFRKVFEEETRKELDWFFDEILPTTKMVDYKIKKLGDTMVIGKTAFRKITIKNSGEVRSPYSIAAMRADTPYFVLWYGGFHGEMEVLFPEVKCDAFKINVPIDIPETNRHNNTVRSHGMFKKFEPISLKPFIDYDNPDYTRIFLDPAVGFNQYDNFMLGFVVYNNFLFPKKVEYFLAPMYGLGSGTLTGMGHLAYFYYPKNKLFREISLAVNGSMFSYNSDLQQFKKFAPKINFSFKKRDPRSSVNSQLKISEIYINKDMQPDLKGGFRREEYWVNEISYSLKNSRVINAYDLKITLQNTENFSKTFAEGNFRLLDYDKNKGLDARIYAGAFLQKKHVFNSSYYLALGGDFGGNQAQGTPGHGDYLFDEIYLGRSENQGLFSQQGVLKNGGFKVPTSIGVNSEWISAINLKSGLPGKIPFEFFFNIGFFPENTSNNTQQLGFAAEGGITLDLGILINAPDIFQIHLPIYVSDKLHSDQNVLNKHHIDEIGVLTYVPRNIFERITFTINFKKLDPFNYVRNYGL